METPLLQRRRGRPSKTDRIPSKQESSLRYEALEDRYSVQEDHVVRRSEKHQKPGKRLSWTPLLGLAALIAAFLGGPNWSRGIACWLGHPCTNAPNEVTGIVTRMELLIEHIGELSDLNIRPTMSLSSSVNRIHYDAEHTTGFANHDTILRISTAIVDQQNFMRSGTHQLTRQLDALVHHASDMRIELASSIDEILPDGRRGLDIDRLLSRLPGQSHRSPGYKVMELFGVLLFRLEDKIVEAAGTGNVTLTALHNLQGNLQLLVGVLGEERKERTAQCAEYDAAHFGFKLPGHICHTDSSELRSFTINALSVAGSMSEVLEPLVQYYNAYVALVQVRGAEYLAYLDPSHAFDREMVSTEEASRRAVELLQALWKADSTWRTTMDAKHRDRRAASSASEGALE